MRRGCCTAAAYRTQHYPASSWLNQADEADDGAEGADVVLREGEGLVTLVLGDAEDAVVVLFALLDVLDEDPLTGVEDIDAAPLEEMDLGDFAASDDVPIAIERGHGIARDTNEEVGALGFELRDGIVLAVVEAHSIIINCREPRNGLHWNKRDALVP